MNTNRLYCEVIKSSSLNATSVLRYVPIDRNMRLSSIVIASRAGITANASHYSKIQFLNGATVIAERSFATTDLAANTNELVSITGDSDLDSADQIAVKYVHNGNGLAVDLDCLLVLDARRG